MLPEVFRRMNLAFIIQSCPRCRIICEFIERINMKLPPKEQIRIIDCTYYQRYKIYDSLTDLFARHFDGFPTCFIKGIKISGINSKIEAEEQIKCLLEEDFVVPELSENKFIKNCSYINKGMFRNKIICGEES